MDALKGIARNGLAPLPSELGSPELGTSVKTGNAEQVKDAAQQFEALLVQQMLKSMWATVPTGQGLLSGSNEEEMYRDMLQEAMAKDIAKNASLGVAEVITRDLNRIQGHQQGTSQPLNSAISAYKK